MISSRLLFFVCAASVVSCSSWNESDSAFDKDVVVAVDTQASALRVHISGVKLKSATIAGQRASCDASHGFCDDVLIPASSLPAGTSQVEVQASGETYSGETGQMRRMVDVQRAPVKPELSVFSCGAKQGVRCLEEGHELTMWDSSSAWDDDRGAVLRATAAEGVSIQVLGQTLRSSGKGIHTEFQLTRDAILTNLGVDANGLFARFSVVAKGEVEERLNIKCRDIEATVFKDFKDVAGKGVAFPGDPPPNQSRGTLVIGERTRMLGDATAPAQVSQLVIVKRREADRNGCSYTDGSSRPPVGYAYVSFDEELVVYERITGKELRRKTFKAPSAKKTTFCPDTIAGQPDGNVDVLPALADEDAWLRNP